MTGTTAPPWVARVFSALRPLAQVQGDAEALRFLEEHGFPAERCARADAVSTLEGQGVLVTEHVPGTPARRGPRTLHILGDLLGRLHTLPAGSGASARDSGSWHHLSLRGGGRREDIDALTALLADVERVAPSDQRALCASLCEDVARTDDGRDLPSAFIHPDFTPPNVIVAPEVGPVLIDWTGAGRGPRVSSLGFLLWAAGGRDLGLVDAVIAGYRAHVRLDVDERARLADAVRAPSLILECWSVVCGRARLPEIVGGLSTNRDLAEAIAARARGGFDR